MLEEEECEAIAYADDLLVVLYGNSRRQLQERGQRLTDRIEAWCDRNKLKLSDTKTEMILAKGRLDKERQPIIKVRGRNIPLRKSVRYLAIHFDEGLRVNAHIAALKEKCKVRRNIPLELPVYSYPADIGRAPARTEIQDFAVREWQHAWDASTKGRHTHLFFPDVRARIEAYWVCLTHEAVQFLSGHGDFNMKLRQFGLVDNEHCQCGLPETVQHIIFDCERHERERNELRESLRRESMNWPITEQELVSRKAFGAFARFAKEVLKKKAAEKRRGRLADNGAS